jgi:hypothetical protein
MMAIPSTLLLLLLLELSPSCSSASSSRDLRGGRCAYEACNGDLVVSLLLEVLHCPGRSEIEFVLLLLAKLLCDETPSSIDLQVGVVVGVDTGEAKAFPLANDVKEQSVAAVGDTEAAKLLVMALLE